MVLTFLFVSIIDSISRVIVQPGIRSFPRLRHCAPLFSLALMCCSPIKRYAKKARYASMKPENRNCKGSEYNVCATAGQSDIEGPLLLTASSILSQARNFFFLLASPAAMAGPVAVRAAASVRCRLVPRRWPIRLFTSMSVFDAPPQNFCYHRGVHFLNAHSSFDMWVERSLQMIDPTVSLAMWDFMLDADIYGTE